METKKLDLTSDLAACQAMAEEFEAYLKSDVLYWQMNAARPGGDQLPKLTVGGFLERVRRLRAAPLLPAQQAALDKAIRQFEHARDAQRARYLARVLHDLHGQLDAWAWFLDDYARRPNEEAPYYPSRAHMRLAIELLLEELAGDSQAIELHRRLSKLDEQLRTDWVNGAFVWHPALEHAFPRQRFWWLYGRLKQPD